MKNIILASLAALALVATGCKDTTDGGVMQVNPQLPVVAPSEAISMQSVLPTNALNLDATGISDIPVATWTMNDSLPEGAAVRAELQISANADFSGARTISLTNTSEQSAAVSAKDWDDAFRMIFGKAPAAKTNYTRVHAYLLVGSQVSDLGYYVPQQLEVTPIDLGIKVEEAYYLVGTINEWSLPTAVKFSHDDSKSVYDDPIFTLSIDISAAQAEGGWWWKIVPQSAFEAQNWDALYGVEVDGDTAAEGNLYEGGNAGQLKTPGQQLFTIDMLACTYKVTNAVPQLWTPGNSNGWNIDASSTLTTTDFTNYSGFLYLNGEWLMTPAANWDNKYALGSGPGTLAFNGASNLPQPEQGAGLYWTVANLGSLTYTCSPITTIGIIGDFNGWGGDVEMTPSDDMLTWTATLTVEDGQGWKFRCNNDWAINLGGTLDELTADGANLTCPAGTYTVTLNIAHHPYTATLTAK